MNEQVLEQVAKMLRAQLRSTGHLWWIGGFVYGVTGNNDPFIILYPADEKLHEKVVRVYPHDFKKLPAFIRPADGGDTEANPNKEQARKKNIYHECPVFEIVTFDGKETQMGRERRFGDVLRLSRKAAEAAAEAQRQQTVAAQQQPAQQQRPPPPPPGVGAPTVATGELPDYRRLAMEAKTGNEFDYAAYMVLRNGVYDSVERIAKSRQSLVPNWQPSPATNQAVLLALEVYRDKRAAAEAGGDAPTAAHQTAKQAAVDAYKALLQE